MDYDNDGWKDLLMSDGHVYPQADKYNWGTSWKERPMLFHNVKGKSSRMFRLSREPDSPTSSPAAAWRWATCSTTARSTP